MTELEYLAKVASERTAAKYWYQCVKGQVFGLFYRHFVEGPHCNKESAERDVEYSRVMGTVADELIAVVMAAENSSPDDIDLALCKLKAAIRGAMK